MLYHVDRILTVVVDGDHAVVVEVDIDLDAYVVVDYACR